jgi:hypothetical protein
MNLNCFISPKNIQNLHLQFHYLFNKIILKNCLFIKIFIIIIIFKIIINIINYYDFMMSPIKICIFINCLRLNLLLKSK